MLINNFEVDVKIKCIEENVTQASLADKIDTSAQYVNRVVKNRETIVNKTFVSMMEALGYDIRLVYEKKGGQD